MNATKHAVALIPSAPVQLRNSDVSFSYRQNSDFFYLTGLRESDSLCLLAPGQAHPFQIFVHPKDPKKELWEGRVLGPAMAKKTLEADAAFASSPLSIFDDAFIEAIRQAECLFYRVGLWPEMDQRVFSLLERAAKSLGRTGRAMWPIVDPQSILGEMRLFKEKSEIACLEKAGEISAAGHVHAMKITRAGMHEYEIEAALYHCFANSGAERLAYPSIVASGENACVLHYNTNRDQLKEGDLLLIDAGAEYEYYAGDITRCIPVGGKFSPAQREVYQAVLTAQKSCLAMAKPGKTMRAIHNHAVEVLTEQLKRLGILKGTTQSLIKKEAYKPYFPHGTGHWLGMDVHDVGRYYDRTYDNHRKLSPGMCFTVEPGLYFGPEAPCPAKYQGIGVRIEDDVLITATGSKVLTSGVPKEIEEVENLCNAT